MQRRTFIASTAAALAAPSLARSQNGRVLRFVPQADLTVLDPMWTTAYVTRNHGYFIYDTLFASDENNAVKPQMVDKYEVSADNAMALSNGSWGDCTQRGRVST